MAFSKIKCIPRNVAKRTIEELYEAIDDALQAIHPTEASNEISHSGHVLQ